MHDPNFDPFLLFIDSPTNRPFECTSAASDRRAMTRAGFFDHDLATVAEMQQHTATEMFTISLTFVGQPYLDSVNMTSLAIERRFDAVIRQLPKLFRHGGLMVMYDDVHG